MIRPLRSVPAPEHAHSSSRGMPLRSAPPPDGHPLEAECRTLALAEGPGLRDGRSGEQAHEKTYAVVAAAIIIISACHLGSSVHLCP